MVFDECYKTETVRLLLVKTRLNLLQRTLHRSTWSQGDGNVRHQCQN